MKMCCDGTLVMPSNYAVMNEEEMSYMEGGAFGDIAVNKKFFSKTMCRIEALKYSGKKLSDGKKYGTERLASEIYAHTILYYSGFSALVMTGIYAMLGYSNKTIDNAVKYIVSHSNPINLGGDNAVRVAIYTAMWI